MLTLDRETADLIATNSVRDALRIRPDLHAQTVELVLDGLLNARAIDWTTASYVLRNADRFLVLPPPEFFDAKWRIDVDLKVHSAAPFAAA